MSRNDDFGAVGAPDTGKQDVSSLDGQWVTVLGRKGMPLKDPQTGQYRMQPGFTVVQVSTQDIIDNPNFPPPAAIDDYEQRIVGHIKWGTAGVGGETYIDIQNGVTYAIAGSHSVILRVGIFSATWGGLPEVYDSFQAPSVPGFSQHIEAQVRYQAAASSGPAYYTGKRVSLNGLAAGPIMRVPPFAQSMMVATTVPANAATMFARAYWNDIAAGPALAARWDNPYLNGVLLNGGVRFVQLDATAAQIATPIYQLGLG